MRIAFFLIMLSGFVPLAWAWWACRRTSLIQALHWALTAWMAWSATMLFADSSIEGVIVDPSRYLALCLTGCAGIAVLGARRPHVGAWNFVVLGLLAVMVLPLLESLMIGGEPLGGLRTAFLGAVLAVATLNYLPTRLAPAAVLLALANIGEMGFLVNWGLAPATEERRQILANVCLLLVPWVAWWSWRRGLPGPTQFDQIWLDFRNRFGLVWGQRVREQFNRSAEHAGWPVFLSWQGLRRKGDTLPSLPAQVEMLETLKALLKRFGGNE